MAAISVDTVVGDRYVLTELIATGGMGEVWRATDRRLHREVAVKVLRGEFARDEVTRQRFRTEARAAARLNSAGIASVYDYGEEATTDRAPRPYLVMELVPGASLEERLRREVRLSATDTLDVLAQAAAALQTAHDHGLIHRDLKPANLLIRTDGIVKLTDFGIVRVLDSTTLTQTGLMLGTVRYMAPEQLSGQAATPASDIYALGVVAYSCLAGHAPFDSEVPMAVALAHVRDPLPPLPPDVPPPVVDLVAQMLAKRPAERPPTAAEVAVRATALRRRTATSTHRAGLKGEVPVGHRTDDHTRYLAHDHTRYLADGAATVTAPVTATRTDRPPTAVMAVPPAGDDPGRSRGRRSRWAWIGGVAAVMGLGLAGALWLVSGTSPVVVPRLGGLTSTAALANVHRLGLQADPRLVDGNQGAGRVVSQEPRSGTSVPSGSHVLIDVASGYVRVDAATLSGRPAAQAAAALSALGLQAVETDTVSTDPPGTVVSVAPGGRVRVGSSVDISVAVAPPPPTTTTTTTVPPGPGAHPPHGSHGKAPTK
jgi:eukaryotic-like serine/threonine-protein kinase